MIQLARYFRVLFLSAQITREVLKLFAEDHIARLNANNPGGIFTTILTAVTSAYNAYFGDMASESLNLAVQQGKTKAMEESRVALVKLIRDNEGLIAYTYRDNTAFLEEFYPHGLDEYNQADLPTLETIGTRYKNVLTAHIADFTPAFGTEYNAALALFIDNRAAQLGAKGDVAEERSDLVGSKQALALQLTKNLLTISLEFVSDESKCAMYFDQAILDEAFRKAERKVEADIDPATTQNVFNNISKPDLKLNLKNTGDAPLNFGFTDTEDKAIPNDPTRVLAPGQEVTVEAGQAGYTSVNKFLNVTNHSTTIGMYVVEKV